MTDIDDLSHLNDYSWGGDGSDLNQPVRAHVEAALLTTDGSYSPPLDRLLTLGSVHDLPDPEAALGALGLAEAHIPDLIRMARDRALNTIEDDVPEGWAPIYALLALKHLDVSQHVADLVPLFDLDSEWFGEELPTVLGRAGAPALGPLRQYLYDASRWHYGRWNAASALAEIGKQHPELRDQAIAILAETMANQANDPETNGFLLSSLLALHATEALPVIRAVFERDAVDVSIAGSWGEVLEALGQPVDRDDPLIQRSKAQRQQQRAANHSQFGTFGNQRAQTGSFPKATANKAAKPSKRKSKRKIASASRKANKKKRR